MTKYISVPVPEEHVLRVYQLLTQLTSGEGAPTAADAPPPAPEPDEALVRRMYEDSYERHRDLLLYFAENPDRWIPSRELAKVLDLPSGSKSVAGMFGAFGRRAKHRYEGAKPWKDTWDPEDGEVNYRVDSLVASWIKAAADKD